MTARDGENAIQAAGTRYPCPCCGFLTLSQASPGSFEICSVCFWEDCPVCAEDIDYAGGPNRVSLRQARRNFMTFGANDEADLIAVRPPRPDEDPRLR